MTPGAWPSFIKSYFETCFEDGWLKLAALGGGAVSALFLWRAPEFFGAAVVGAFLGYGALTILRTMQRRNNKRSP